MKDHEMEVRAYLRRNYLAHAVEGGLFMGGLAFTHPVTVLPKMVESLGGKPFMTWASVALYIGFMLPGLFTSHWIEHLKRMHPFTIVTGIFQRLPYLVAGLILLLSVGAGDRLALWAILLTPFMSGLAGGLSVTAWQELVAKTIPADRRASLWAARYVVSALIGFGAGFIVKHVLQQWPGMIGYGILHLITFGFLFFSYIFFCTIRETSLPPKKDPESQSYRQYLKSFPGLIRADGRLALYLSVKVLSASAFVVYSFLSVHVLSALHKTESFLGTLLMVQMAGMLIGNICGGWLGNRLGGRKVLLAGHGGFMVMALCAIVLTREWQAYLLFFIFGVAFYLERIGSLTFNMDLAPVEKRVVYFALFGVAKLIGLLLASLAGPMWQNYATELSYGPQITFLITCAPVVILMAASIFLIVLIPDPHFEQER